MLLKIEIVIFDDLLVRISEVRITSKPTCVTPIGHAALSIPVARFGLLMDVTEAEPPPTKNSEIFRP